MVRLTILAKKFFSIFFTGCMILYFHAANAQENPEEAILQNINNENALEDLRSKNPYSNIAIINQIGSDNESFIQQVKSGNGILINQVGYENFSNIFQNGIGNNTYLNQEGNGNYYESVIKGNSNFNYI